MNEPFFNVGDSAIVRECPQVVKKYHNLVGKVIEVKFDKGVGSIGEWIYLLKFAPADAKRLRCPKMWFRRDHLTY